jgi:hypothetical protein
MRARHWMVLILLLSFPSVHAEESDPPMDLIEMLGETGEADSDIEIAMSEIEIKQAKLNVKEALPKEVKDDE